MYHGYPPDGWAYGAYPPPSPLSPPLYPPFAAGHPPAHPSAHPGMPPHLHHLHTAPAGHPGVAAGAAAASVSAPLPATPPPHAVGGAPGGVSASLPLHSYPHSLHAYPYPPSPMPPPYLPQPSLAHHHSILYPAGAASMPSPMMPDGAEVKLEIICKGLWDRDKLSKSDPTCVVFLEASPEHSPYGYSGNLDADISSIRWREHKRTECIKDDLNPHFKVHIAVPYRFEQLQHIRFGIWDIDSKKIQFDKHDFLGDVKTTLGELVRSRVWTSKLSSSNARDTRTLLGGKRDLGTITVIVHETKDRGLLLLKGQLSASKLDRKDFLLMSSDPFFIITQVGATSQQSRSQLYKSEVIHRNINPVWKPFQAKATLPKGGGKDSVMLEFLVYDKDRHRRDDEIGRVTCSVADLEAAAANNLPLINQKRKKRKRNYKNSGVLHLNNFRAKSMPSLVDYLQGGLNLHFSVAVDLTASNGNPTEPLSLHYRHDIYGNRYLRALTAIANVIRVYTPSENLYMAYGFGAELPGRPGFTSSCFPLSLGPNPHCRGIEGIMQAYNTALNSVKLSGPTNFAPLIDAVSRVASQRPNTQNDQHYDVLLILTDGVVSDFAPTVDRIISASKNVPLSIIIIGIGNRDFKKMDALDSDGELLRSVDNLRQADRDICQFVAFRDYETAPPERLGAAVLAELPAQIVEYFVGQVDPPIMPGQRAPVPQSQY